MFAVYWNDALFAQYQKAATWYCLCGCHCVCARACVCMALGWFGKAARAVDSVQSISFISCVNKRPYVTGVAGILFNAGCTHSTRSSSISCVPKCLSIPIFESLQIGFSFFYRLFIRAPVLSFEWLFVRNAKIGLHRAKGPSGTHTHTKRRRVRAGEKAIEILHRY